jgi:outer membrane protein OmpA-like peptidoglycan-associated protein
MEKLKCLLVLVLFFLSSPIFANDTTIVVHFSTNQATISTQEQAKILNSIQPKIATIQNVMVLGHTDQIGSEKYNQQLSNKRAKTVQQFLIANGINANLITIVEGKGETELLTNLGCKK